MPIAHWFMSLDDAREKCEAWRRDYNEVRPHSAIGNKPPIANRTVSGTGPALTKTAEIWLPVVQRRGAVHRVVLSS